MAKRNVEPAPKPLKEIKSEDANEAPNPVFTMSSVCTSSQPLVQQSVTIKLNPAK